MPTVLEVVPRGINFRTRVPPVDRWVIKAAVKERRPIHRIDVFQRGSYASLIRRRLRVFTAAP